MQIKSKAADRTLYIYLQGELDECFADRFRSGIDSLINTGVYYQNIVFNLRELSFMDSTGIGVLIGRYKKFKESGVNFYIQAPPLNVEKVLELSGIYSIMRKAQ